MHAMCQHYTVSLRIDRDSLGRTRSHQEDIRIANDALHNVGDSLPGCESSALLVGTCCADTSVAMVIAALAGEVTDLLTAAEVVLEASRAAVKLASIRSVQTRLYSLGHRHVLELDSQRTIVFEPDRKEVAIFPDIQTAVDTFAPAELVFRRLVPPLAARLLYHTEDAREQLSLTDKRFLVLLARGCCNKEIGKRLHVADSTVKNRLSAIYARFGVQTRSEMVATALALGLLSDGDAIFDSLTESVA